MRRMNERTRMNITSACQNDISCERRISMGAMPLISFLLRYGRANMRSFGDSSDNALAGDDDGLMKAKASIRRWLLAGQVKKRIAS